VTGRKFVTPENHLHFAQVLMCTFNLVIFFLHSTFIRNQHERGAIFSYRFPMVLQGQNQLIENSMSAMFLVDSKVNCYDEILFEGNNGTLGGAIQLHGNTHVSCY